MGIEIETVRYLKRAMNLGADFSDLVTLGRQNLFVADSELRKLFGSAVSLEVEPYTRWRWARRFYRNVGARQVSIIDNNPNEKSPEIIHHDLNVPVDKSLHKKFSVVLDVGTLEHVFNVPVAFRNVMNMTKVGGHVVLVTVANNYCGHGFYQFSPELMFQLFNGYRGFHLLDLTVCELSPLRRWYKVSDPFHLQERVCVSSKWPIVMMVCAKRETDIDLTESDFLIQQSDYQAQQSNTETAAQKGEVDQWAKPKFDRLRYYLIENWPWLARFLETIRFSSYGKNFSFRNKRAFHQVDK